MYLKIGKRIVDLVLATLLLLTTLPITLLVSLAVWLYDRGPIFADNSYRVGKFGKSFLMYKFRSMIINAHLIIQNDPRLSSVRKKWIIQDKLPINEDPRITPVGKIIRKFDFDELAQLINVIKGDMSIVGPRPWFEAELKSNLKKYPEFKRKVYDNVLSVKPGITGLWQVSGRNLRTKKERFELDIQYSKSISFILDTFIILKTPWVILKKIFRGEEYA